jgi:4a-hydroxytetrahydrobiopterin dehydratase
VAEAEGHHPDLELGWGRVKIVLWTHSIGGLSENDFIVAAKADRALDAA